jgi:replication factor C large subunit
MSWDYIEMNASDRRTGKELRRIALPGASTNTFSLEGNYFALDEGKRHVIILDEADNIDSKDDVGGIAAVSELLKVTQQPVILIVNDLYELTRRSESIKKACKVVRFENLQKEELARVLHHIAETEDLRISFDAAMKLVEMADGDARAAINDLQSISSAGTITTKETADLSKRNKTVDTREGVERLFRSTDIKENLRTISLLEEDPGSLSLWIDENVPQNATDIYGLANGFEALSRATQFVRWAGKFSYYRLWLYSSDLMALGTKMTSGGYDHKESARFPLVLTKFRHRNSVMATRDALVGKISAYSHTSARNERDAMMPFLRNAFHSSDRFATSMTERLNLSIEEIAALMGETEDSSAVSKIAGDAGISSD